MLAFRGISENAGDLIEPRLLRPIRWAGPDLMLAFTLAWVRRRPDYIPAILVAFVFLLADLLFQRPPGLLSVIVVLACELQRRRTMLFRTQPLLVEWFNVAIVVAAIALANRLVLSVTFVDQVPLGLNLMQVIATVLVYPLVVFATQVIFGVRRTTKKDIAAMGVGI
ncbi:rod shape-determining protein MreD [Roseovarius albus]|nr:rod shape-determining protein MreD [Roseovarius albus]